MVPVTQQNPTYSTLEIRASEPVDERFTTGIGLDSREQSGTSDNFRTGSTVLGGSANNADAPILRGSAKLCEVIGLDFDVLYEICHMFGWKHDALVVEDHGVERAVGIQDLKRFTAYGL